MNAAFGKPSQKEEEKPFLLDIAPIGGGKLIWTLTLTTFSDELSVEIFFKLN